MHIFLVHWSEFEAIKRIEALQAAGHHVTWKSLDGANYRSIRTLAPDVFVIDLTRLPSHGREVAMALRSWKDTRYIPIVFVGGEPEKVEKTRAMFPDAVYVDWSRVRGGLRDAVKNAPADPVVYKSSSGPYSDTPLPKKLGVKPGAIVLLFAAPKGFEDYLGELPVGAKVTRRGDVAKADLVVWFLRCVDELSQCLVEVKARGAAGLGGLWLAWPKKSSSLASDLGESIVRAAALRSGWVDHKVCAIDATWSGLRFAPVSAHMRKSR